MAKRILILGGTGAMGVYLVPELIRRGYIVDVTSRGGGRKGLRISYIAGDAKDDKFIDEVLGSQYDVIIDFMTYSTEEFKLRAAKLLDNCKHYIFTSTYRVFSDVDKVITEKTPRLLDVSKDKEFLDTDEYALSKARSEDVLHNSGRKNWTIIRPSITYSKTRFQLGVLESEMFIKNAIDGKLVAFPREMLEKNTTMTWAGDVAKMVASLVLNDKAYGEDFNVVTSESRPWLEVVEIYQKAIGLNIKEVSLAEFLEIYPARYQVLYDRMFDRVMDNSKILKVCGMSQSDLTALDIGLSGELHRFIKNPRFGGFDEVVLEKLNRLTESRSVRLARRLRPRTRLNQLRQKLRPRTRLKDLKHKIRIRTRLRALWARYSAYRMSALNHRKDGLIITLTSNFNYGNIIQRYALKTYLNKHGFVFDNISVPDWSHKINQEPFVETIRFVDKYIGGRIFDNNSSKGYKRYIVGSDQVWRNWSNDWSVLGIYFLDFLSDSNASRISYAASFGVDSLNDASIDDELISRIRPLLKKFDSISVREDSGVSLVDKILGSKKSGRAKLVLDPVLMLEAEDYSWLIDNSSNHNDKSASVFGYILDMTESKSDLIKKIASSTGGGYSITNPQIDQRYDSVETWLKGFRDSEFVVTDSFHGVVLSIINKKDFIVFGNKERGMARFTSLFDQLGISDDRLVDTYVDTDKIKPIQWKEVDRKLNLLRKDSGEWLMSTLR